MILPFRYILMIVYDDKTRMIPIHWTQFYFVCS